MTLEQQIAQLLSLPLPDAIKAAAIAALVSGTATAAPVGSTAEQSAANLSALRNIRPDAVAGTGGKQAAQSDVAQKRAEAYVVRPYPQQDSEGNPVKYAANEFTRAGYTEVLAPNGPVERFGSAAAMLNNDYRAAVQYVIANYAAGTANIAAIDSPAEQARQRAEWAAAQQRMREQPPPQPPPPPTDPFIENAP